MEPFNFFEEGRGGGGIVTKGEARRRGGGTDLDSCRLRGCCLGRHCVNSQLATGRV